MVRKSYNVLIASGNRQNEITHTKSFTSKLKEEFMISKVIWNNNLNEMTIQSQLFDQD